MLIKTHKHDIVFVSCTLWGLPSFRPGFTGLYEVNRRCFWSVHLHNNHDVGVLSTERL